MRLPYDGISAGTATGTARSTLAALTVTLGTDGLTEATARPGLLALVDQHAAAIRDSLDVDHRRLSPAALAGYAEGLRAAALDHGWTPPSGAVDWSEPDWLLTRLLAVCALDRSLPDGPVAPPGIPEDPASS